MDDPRIAGNYPGAETDGPTASPDKVKVIVGNECAPERVMDELRLLNDKYIAVLNALDLMRDEFMRIRACPGADNEIKGLCDRAISGIERIVPITVECDQLRAELAAERGRHAATLEIIEKFIGKDALPNAKNEGPTGPERDL